MLFGTNVGSMWGIQRFGFRRPRRLAARLRRATIALLPVLSISVTAAPSAAAELPHYLRDRGVVRLLDRRPDPHTDVVWSD